MSEVVGWTFFFVQIMCSGNVDLFVCLYLYFSCRWLNINLERKLSFLIEAVRGGNVQSFWRSNKTLEFSL